MSFKVVQMADGDWLATTSSPVPIGVFAAGRELALERLRERVEYREEMAPVWRAGERG
jgi:molybdopterin synthase catalytic subunit